MSNQWTKRNVLSELKRVMKNELQFKKYKSYGSVSDLRNVYEIQVVEEDFD